MEQAGAWGFERDIRPLFRAACGASALCDPHAPGALLARQTAETPSWQARAVPGAIAGGETTDINAAIG